MLLFNLNYEAKKCLLHQGRFTFYFPVTLATSANTFFLARYLLCRSGFLGGHHRYFKIVLGYVYLMLVKPFFTPSHYSLVNFSCGP